MLPPDGGADAGEDGGAELASLTVGSLSYHGTAIVSGIGAKSISGLVSIDAVAIGVRFADIGSGYWVVPVQGLDPTYPGQRDFGLTASFNAADPPGLHPLAFVGIGSDGTGGEQFSQQFCIESRLPDNNHACYPRTPCPPQSSRSGGTRASTSTCTSLPPSPGWPQGQDINPKTDLIVGDAGAISTAAALLASNHIDRDSWGNCAPDGWFEEDLIFQTAPAPGSYRIRADPYCRLRPGCRPLHFHDLRGRHRRKPALDLLAERGVTLEPGHRRPVAWALRLPGTVLIPAHS